MIKIGSKMLGPDREAFIVAEIGGNHGGDPALARRMVKAAADCGAAAVKFQAYRTSEFLSPFSPYFDELAAEELAFEDLGQLVALAHDLDICAGLTIFDLDGLDLAKDCGADFIKISSGDISHNRLLSAAAQTGRPLIISTGASTRAEVRTALDYLRPAEDHLLLMQCASLYPSPPEAANLAVMRTWLDEGLAAGYSDHVLGPSAALAALRLGALAVEKHFTTSRNLPGGDNSISAEAEEIALLAAEARRVPARTEAQQPQTEADRTLLGSPHKYVHPLEEPVRALIRRTATAVVDLQAGRQLTWTDLALRRPPQANGRHFPPSALPHLIGRTLRKDVKAGRPLMPADLKDEAHG